MGIFRGIGGTGNSTDDGVVDAVTEQAVIATNKATEAANSATSAYNSAQSASTSKDTATTQANAAQASANTASTHATNAATSATSAATSATSATASATTATTKASEAATSATNAATSETNAATSATTATTKASEAATSATTATTKAGEASTSATNAASSATSASTSASTATTKASEASTSAANAASSYDDFDDRYLGAKSSAPSTDNDGDALVTGALYFDTTSDSMKVYSGFAWLDAYASLSGALIATNNLSDLNNVSTARTNLGLGTAATTASTDYATAAQGTTADNALPKSGGAMTGAITTNSTFDGRDVSADGAKLDGIEAGATADQTAGEIKTAYESNADTNAFTDADHTKLDGIEASADVTDTANVTAAGALMDSELTSEASVKALNQGVATTDSPSFAGLTVDTNTLYVDATNNRVGIGTTSPDYFLDIEGDDPDIRQEMPSTSSSNLIQHFFTVDGVQEGQVVYNKTSGSEYFGLRTTRDITFQTGGTAERMRIDSSGRVGIGTSSPSKELHVEDDITELLVEGTNNSVGTTVASVSVKAPFYRKAGLTIYDESDNEDFFIGRPYGATNGFVITNDGSERMRIDSSGRVGIGTSSPSGSLVVSFSGAEGIEFFPNNFTNGNTIQHYDRSSSAYSSVKNIAADHRFNIGSTERMRIDTSGNLLVGRTSTGSSLTDHGHQLYSSGYYYLYSSATGNSDAFRMYDGNGTLRATIDGDGDYTDLSDVRAKENIVNAPSVLSTINDLQVRSFTWKVDGKHQTYGFVAQELNEAIPEAVSLPEEEDGMWGVKHAKLVPVLVKAIQEQQATIESLTARVEQLENN